MNLVRGYEDFPETDSPSEMLYSHASKEYIYLDTVCEKTMEEIEKLQLVNTRRRYLHIDVINMIKGGVSYPLSVDHEAEIFYAHTQIDKILQSNPMFDILESRPSLEWFDDSEEHESELPQLQQKVRECLPNSLEWLAVFELQMKKGLEKYGRLLTVEPNGRDAIQDLREELMDSLMYACQALMQGRKEEVEKICAEYKETMDGLMGRSQDGEIHL